MVLEKWAVIDAPYQSFGTYTFIVGIFLIQFPRLGTWIETLKQQNELSLIHI